VAIRRRRAGHHPRRRKVRGFGYLSHLGPGIVTGAADDDPSGIGTYSQIGASFRFGLLWTALFTLPLAAAMQEAAARLGLVTGQGLAALIKERFPRWVLLGAVALVAIANVFNIGADLGAMAAAVGLVVPGFPFVAGIIAITSGLLALEVSMPYRRYAHVLRWLTLSLLAYVIVLFVIDVDWAEVLKATFVPHVSWSRVEIAALIAILGTTISPYLFFWQTSEEVEEEPCHPSDTGGIDRRSIMAMRTDVLSGMASAVVVMWAIMVATGATLGDHGGVTIRTADQAARALQPIAGSIAKLVFAAGIIGTGALAVPVLAGSTAYALSETFGGAEGLERPLRRAPMFYGVIGGAMAIGLALNFVGIDPVRSLYFAAILNGLAAPPLILLMILLSRSEGVVGAWAGRRLSVVLMCLAFLAMAGLPIAYLLV
jgi:NRAMP (natural resistance-associated macrophage protein)-like metal ion transporter